MSINIYLDAGHGKNTSGKRCMKKLDPKETREWFLNDRIMDKVQKKLTTYECTVIRTDDTTGKTDVSLKNRVTKSNKGKADVFISMHHNAGLNGRKGGGTVVYYYGGSERKEQAKDLYNAIVNETKLVGNRASKVIKNGFYVIKYTDCPAFLVENGFMDSPTDVPIILTEEHAEKTAVGVVNFLVKEYKLKKKVVKEEEEKPAEKKEEKPVEKLPSLKGYKGYSIVDGLKSFGHSSTFSYRKKLWKLAGKKTTYKGTATQNLDLLNILKKV